MCHSQILVARSTPLPLDISRGKVMPLLCAAGPFAGMECRLLCGGLRFLWSRNTKLFALLHIQVYPLYLVKVSSYPEVSWFYSKGKGQQLSGTTARDRTVLMPLPFTTDRLIECLQIDKIAIKAEERAHERLCEERRFYARFLLNQTISI